MDIVSIAPAIWVGAALVAILAGTVKGAVGFAMPMVMISGVSSFAPPEIALAALILPTLATNLALTLREGLGPARAEFHAFKLFILPMLVTMAIAAQLVPAMSDRALQLSVGLPVAILSLIQIVGWRPRLVPSRPIQAVVGALAGVLGGIGGVWGPPTTLYLTAIGTDKARQLRIQGVIYGLGSVMLLLSHLRSGILNGQTIWLSLAMLVPAWIGLRLGLRLHDRMDQERFRLLTLLVLLVAGLNLVRRGLMA